MQHIGNLAAQQAQAVAPRGATGKLAGAVTYKVQAKAVPLYAMVVDTVRAGDRKRTNYARILEFSQKHGHMGWMRDAIKSVWSQVDHALDAAANAIERHWGRYG